MNEQCTGHLNIDKVIFGNKVFKCLVNDWIELKCASVCLCAVCILIWTKMCLTKQSIANRCIVMKIKRFKHMFIQLTKCNYKLKTKNWIFNDRQLTRLASAFMDSMLLFSLYLFQPTNDDFFGKFNILIVFDSSILICYFDRSRNNDFLKIQFFNWIWLFICN